MRLSEDLAWVTHSRIPQLLTQSPFRNWSTTSPPIMLQYGSIQTTKVFPCSGKYVCAQPRPPCLQVGVQNINGHFHSSTLVGSTVEDIPRESPWITEVERRGRSIHDRVMLRFHCMIELIWMVVSHYRKRRQLWLTRHPNCQGVFSFNFQCVFSFIWRGVFSFCRRLFFGWICSQVTAFIKRCHVLKEWTNGNDPHHHLPCNREGFWGTKDDFTTGFPPFFSVLHCPLRLGELQACPFPDVVLPPLPLSALSSSPFHCALQDGFWQTWYGQIESLFKKN